jgi:hypothetical protein
MAFGSLLGNGFDGMLFFKINNKIF